MRKLEQLNDITGLLVGGLALALLAWQMDQAHMFTPIARRLAAWQRDQDEENRFWQSRLGRQVKSALNHEREETDHA